MQHLPVVLGGRTVKPTLGKAALVQISNLLGVTVRDLTGRVEHFSSATEGGAGGKAVTNLQVIAKRLDVINQTMEQLRQERDMLKRQMMNELPAWIQTLNLLRWSFRLYLAPAGVFFSLNTSETTCCFARK